MIITLPKTCPLVMASQVKKTTCMQVLDIHFQSSIPKKASIFLQTIKKVMDIKEKPKSGNTLSTSYKEQCD